jgi:HEAT repeat protein
MAHRHRQIEAEVERLNLLRDTAPSEAIPALRKALSDRVNLIVAKAAKMAAELRLHDLLPDLLRAFDRLFEKPVERDPQCWGKNAISKALVTLDHREAAPFVRGIHHIQMEPVWGGEADTAATLRGTCALALPSCSDDIARGQILRHLVDALADRALPVRCDAVRAIAQMQGDEAILLLRLKARQGDAESEVVGQAFDYLFQLESDQALPFVADFLQPKLGPVAEEAALALGSSRLSGAASLLEQSFARQRDPDYRQVLLRAISTTRQPPPSSFLLNMVRNGREAEALNAIEALALHRDSADIRRQVEHAAGEREERARPLQEIIRPPGERVIPPRWPS